MEIDRLFWPTPPALYAWTLEGDRIVEIDPMTVAQLPVEMPVIVTEVRDYVVTTSLGPFSKVPGPFLFTSAHHKADPGVAHGDLGDAKSFRQVHQRMVKRVERAYAEIDRLTETGTVFRLNLPFDAEFDDWCHKHCPSGRVESIDILGLRYVVTDPDEAFAWKIRWG